MFEGFNPLMLLQQLMNPNAPPEFVNGVAEQLAGRLAPPPMQGPMPGVPGMMPTPMDPNNIGTAISGMGLTGAPGPQPGGFGAPGMDQMSLAGLLTPQAQQTMGAVPQPLMPGESMGIPQTPSPMGALTPEQMLMFAKMNQVQEPSRQAPAVAPQVGKGVGQMQTLSLPEQQRQRLTLAQLLGGR